MRPETDKISVDIYTEQLETHTIGVNCFTANASAMLSAQELKFCREAQNRFKVAQGLLRKRLVIE
jgi:hypothetical protein